LTFLHLVLFSLHIFTFPTFPLFPFSYTFLPFLTPFPILLHTFLSPLFFFYAFPSYFLIFLILFFIFLIFFLLFLVILFYLFPIPSFWCYIGTLSSNFPSEPFQRVFILSLRYTPYYWLVILFSFG